MGNIIVAIATLIIGFMLATYGVYTTVESHQRTSLTQSIGSRLSRVAVMVQERRDEDAGRPVLSDEEQRMIAREGFSSVRFEIGRNTSGEYACAVSSDVGETTREAMQMVSRDRPGSFVSGACGQSAADVGTEIAVSMRIGN